MRFQQKFKQILSVFSVPLWTIQGFFIKTYNHVVPGRQSDGIIVVLIGISCMYSYYDDMPTALV